MARATHRAAGSPAACRELFRYAKAGRTRTYHLKHLDGERAELWVASPGPGNSRKVRRLVTFDRIDDADVFLDDVERELRRGGWSQVRRCHIYPVD